MYVLKYIKKKSRKCYFDIYKIFLENKERFQKGARKRYQNLSEEEKDKK